MSLSLKGRDCVNEHMAGVTNPSPPETLSLLSYAYKELSPLELKEAKLSDSWLKAATALSHPPTQKSDPTQQLTAQCGQSLLLTKTHSYCAACPFATVHDSYFIL